MALLHRATLRPTKLELLAGWLPDRPWSRVPAGAPVERVASFRFDDPAGAVGIETMLVRAGDGPVHHVPLTYRDAPLGGGDRWLIGTTEHSVLGPRWVYDACGDQVYAAELAGAILTGTGQAEEFVDVDGRLERREPAMTATGSGTGDTAVPAVSQVLRVDEDDPTRIRTDSVSLAVVRVLDGSGTVGGPVLTGTWPAAAGVPLAYLTA
jgi:hypothetical protein